MAMTMKKRSQDTKAISEASSKGKRSVRGFFIGVANGPVAGRPFECGGVGASVGTEAAALSTEGQACDHDLFDGGS